MLRALGAMGERNTTNAVVDSTGKVYGVQRLRVVDASIFPLLPPGHPQATVCKFMDQNECMSLANYASTDMLAEKIAGDILDGR